MSRSRRTFLKAAAVSTAATALGSRDAGAMSQPDDAAPARDYLELRAYRLRPGTPHTLLDGYLANALIPALNRKGIRAVGVFTEPDAPDGPAVWVLIPHRSLDSLQAVTAAINTDPAVVAAGADYLRAPTKENPAFDRIDSWLHLSFAGLPRLQVPQRTRDRQARIFELRVYESYSELTALKKVEMFNAGEIEVMQQVDLSPVFYGQALVGRDMPHLSYLLCSSDRASHDRNWKAFLDHPVWKRLVADPQYANTVSKITSRFLVPTSYSQI
ncbi:MAG: NIPSNAP family protein [Gemmatimonadaceae bacterium]|nr:NIPSNAP family protein [Gemmatimonadaceae bacterium]